jgi:hypothetical protein
MKSINLIFNNLLEVLNKNYKIKRMDKPFNICQNLSYQNQNNVDEESSKRLNNFYGKDLSTKNILHQKACTQTSDKNFLNKITSSKPYKLEEKKQRINPSRSKSRSNSKNNPSRSRSRSHDEIDQKRKRAKTPVKQDRNCLLFKDGKKGKINRIISYNNLTVVENNLSAKHNNENLLYEEDPLLDYEKNEEILKHDALYNFEETLINNRNYQVEQEPISENLPVKTNDQEQDVPDKTVTEPFTVIKFSSNFN